MITKHTRRAPNDGNTHGPSWRAGYDAGADKLYVNALESNLDRVRASHDALLTALWTAEEVLGNNIVGLSDLLDLRVRQGDPETLRRLDELNKGWLAVVRAIKACEVQS